MGAIHICQVKPVDASEPWNLATIGWPLENVNSVKVGNLHTVSSLVLNEDLGPCEQWGEVCVT